MVIKKFFLMVFALIAFAIAGCATTSLSLNESVQLDRKIEIMDAWFGCVRVKPKMNSGGGGWCDGSLRKITFVIGNSTDKSRKVEIVCTFKRDGGLFGVRTVLVNAGQKLKTVVYGVVSPYGFGNGVVCGLQ